MACRKILRCSKSNSKAKEGGGQVPREQWELIDLHIQLITTSTMTMFERFQGLTVKFSSDSLEETPEVSFIHCFKIQNLLQKCGALGIWLWVTSGQFVLGPCDEFMDDFRLGPASHALGKRVEAEFCRFLCVEHGSGACLEV
jgi:hypothetical protein